MSATRNRIAPTARDHQVLTVVRRHVRRHGCAPTRAEIAAALGISRPTAEGHLQALQQHGLLKLLTCWRGIVVTKRGAAA